MLDEGRLISEVQWRRVKGWPINRSLLLLGNRLANDQDAYKWKGKDEECGGGDGGVHITRI